MAVLLWIEFADCGNVELRFVGCDRVILAGFVLIRFEQDEMVPLKWRCSSFRRVDDNLHFPVARGLKG